MSDIPVFDQTQQKTRQWIDFVARQMGSTDAQRGYLVLRAVLHAVRDRLPVDEASQLAAQMPMLLRGFYYEGWRPATNPEKYRHREDFLEHIARDVPELDPVQRERAASAVFAALDEYVGEGETSQVWHALPEEVRALWPGKG